MYSSVVLIDFNNINMKSILTYLIAFLGAYVSSKYVDYGGFDTVATIDMRINPVHQDNNNNNSIDHSGSEEAGNPETMQMLAALKNQVSTLGDKVDKNADYLDKVKDSINSLDEVNQNVRELNEAFLEMQQQQLLLQQQLQQQQMVRPSCTVDASLTCRKSIVNGTEWHSGNYGPEHVLIDSCDDQSDEHAASENDWWLLPTGATRADAFFNMDLGCQRCVNKVTVRNAQNGIYQSRSTKDFLVSVATESDPGNWMPVVNGTLSDIRGLSCEDQPGKITFQFAATQARFARFEVLSYYGVKGAALQFFDMS